MTMKKIFFAAAAAVVAMASCTDDENASLLSTDEVVFASATIATRTIGDTWEDNDNIGIFMYDHELTEAARNANVHYVTDQSGTFDVATDETPIYYPQLDAVDFYAYYPYQADMVGTTYEADVTDQSDAGAIDFLSASITTGITKTKVAQSFAFDHRLTMLKLVITPKSSITSIAGLKVWIENANTKASYSVLTGDESVAPSTPGTIVFPTTETLESDEVTVKTVTTIAILIPETTADDVTLWFEHSNGDQFAAPFAGKQHDAGYVHTYNVEIGYTEATFHESTINEWETSDSDTDDIIDAEEVKDED